MINPTETEQINIDKNSSKGNQLKWHIGDKWYKADYLGYEGLSEVIISKLLQKSNLMTHGIQTFVDYNLERIQYNDHEYIGCVSNNFLIENESIITLNKLFRIYKDEDIIEIRKKYPEIKDQIKYIVDTVEQITGLKHFGQYLTNMLEIDMLFLNEDRHFNNIAVLYNEKTGKFNYCPIFDNGAALLSDMIIEYPIEKDIYECIDKVKAKPFSSDFVEQTDISESLYGVQFKHWISNKDIEELLDKIKKEEIYSNQILERMEVCIKERLRMFSYMQIKVPDNLVSKNNQVTIDKEGTVPDITLD